MGLVKTIKGTCETCSKRYRTSCNVYKEENRRPKPGEWCYGYKAVKQTIHPLPSKT